MALCLGVKKQADKRPFQICLSLFLCPTGLEYLDVRTPGRCILSQQHRFSKLDSSWRVKLATANSSPLPMGLLLSPTVHLYPPPPRFRTQQHVGLQRCRRCRAYINTYCRFAPHTAAGQTWTCALCEAQQPFQSEVNQYVQPAASPDGGPQLAALPVELACKVIETVTPSSSHAAVLPQTVFPASEKPSITAGIHPRSTGEGLNYVFVVDRHIAKTDLGDLKRQLTTLLRDLPPQAGLALLAFSNTVTLFDLTAKGVASGLVVTGETGPTLESLEGYLQSAGSSLPTVASSLDTFLDCIDSLEQSASSLSDQKLFSPRAIGPAVEWTLAMVEAGREVDRLRRESLASKQPNGHSSSSPNSSGSLSSPSAFAFTQLILLTSGAPDFGPGEVTMSDSETSSPENEDAITYWSSLGQRCHLSHLQIDMIAQGLGNFGVRVVRKCVDQSGGSISLHKSLPLPPPAAPPPPVATHFSPICAPFSSVRSVIPGEWRYAGALV